MVTAKMRKENHYTRFIFAVFFIRFPFIKRQNYIDYTELKSRLFLKLEFVDSAICVYEK
jgi:hypothetical protein